MKEISGLLESLYQREWKKYIILALFVFGTNLAICWISQSTNEMGFMVGYYEESLPTKWLLFQTIVIYVILQIRRMMRLRESGKTRILLLPVKKMNYFLAELLFLFSTLCLSFVALVLSYVVGYWIISAQLPHIENGFVYFLEVKGTLPIDTQSWLLWIIGLFTMSLLFCVITFARFSSHLMAKIILIGMILFIPVTLLLVYLSTCIVSLELSLLARMILMLAMIILDLGLLWFQYRFFKMRKVGD